eukprot:CAMPEP_0198135278 /NCGR_PEP_ID=MMETSP1442-20131203/60508_1 /TAXON_ID= /ORGANISM="Craspedostauros australis, Strain CCMP3328" /LENGTH=241 /DNA_ID=CAMNT_0043796441 /DNA_START=226 /DNA_END=951 /DNA_ORIENTATION=+
MAKTVEELQPSIERLMTTTSSALEFGKLFAVHFVRERKELAFLWSAGGIPSVGNREFAWLQLVHQTTPENRHVVFAASVWPTDPHALCSKNRHREFVLHCSVVEFLGTVLAVDGERRVLFLPSAKICSIHSDGEHWRIVRVECWVPDNFFGLQRGDAANPFPQWLSTAVSHNGCPRQYRSHTPKRDARMLAFFGYVQRKWCAIMKSLNPEGDFSLAESLAPSNESEFMSNHISDRSSGEDP